MPKIPQNSQKFQTNHKKFKINKIEFLQIKYKSYPRLGGCHVTPSPPRPPATFPLASLEELWAWDPTSRADDQFLVCDVPFQPLTPLNGPDTLIAERLRPKLMLCHDMMGGYLQVRMGSHFLCALMYI